MECSSSDLNVSSNIHWRKRQGTEDKTRPAILDFGVLDCPICVKPITTPIFQCDNGHIACSSCCPKLNNKCPVCASPISHKRCRAMESVLESIFIPCPNAKLGCTKNVPYGIESTHEKECDFSPCSCPIQGCNYTGAYKDLYVHYNFSTHQKSMFWGICCGTPYHFLMNSSDRMVIIREHEKGLLFAVQCFREPCGVYISVSCIAPSAPEVELFSYHISYTFDGHTVTYESPEMKRIREVSSQIPHENFMLIPQNLLRCKSLRLKLCIREVEPRARRSRVI